MHRLLLRAFSLAISAVAISSFSGTSMAAHASLKTSAAPESSSADNPSWKEYKKLLENYYFLDKQKADHISCNVSSPTIQEMINQSQQKFGSRVTIDANLPVFSVTYDRTRGVSFNTPHIKVSFLPTAKFAADEQSENWRKVTEKILNEEVFIVEKTIAAQLADMDFSSLSPEKQKNLSLTKNGDATVVSFDELDEGENKHFRVVFSGSTEKLTESSPISNTITTSDYQPLNGKLALAHQAGETTKGSTKANGTTSISYQDLGSAFFPAQYLGDITFSRDTQQPKTQHIETDFKDCKTSNLTEANGQDNIEALRKAADQGDSDAQYELGKDYYKAIGVEKDNKQAVVWWRKAADQGNAVAQNILAAAYHNGDGVEKDDKEAVNWLRKAADQGNATGQFLLGTAYANGEGVEKDNKQAAVWWRKAADQGNAAAQKSLEQ